MGPESEQRSKVVPYRELCMREQRMENSELTKTINYALCFPMFICLYVVYDCSFFHYLSLGFIPCQFLPRLDPNSVQRIRIICSEVLSGRRKFPYYDQASPKICMFSVSISVSTRACHARKLGSTPRQRVFCGELEIFSDHNINLSLLRRPRLRLCIYINT